ncbi:hypothetical protein [Micromonospora sediminicola]|uniref:hypothetical protein n=1 Tax=Micromonospora sediminicola TaxID=946078 RepID=UPI00378CE0AB
MDKRRRQRRKVWIHRGLASMWVLLAIPAALWWAESILFVILVSLYANFASELATSEAADDRDVCDRLDRIERALAERGDDQ